MDGSVRKNAKIWRLLPHDQALIDRLSRALNVSPIVAQLLANRNVTDHLAAQKFLACSLAGMHEPERMPGLADACERIILAIQAGKRICVYGDYDVDGVTGTAILLNGLRLLGANLEFHVPHRLEDGYGLSTETLRKLAAKGVQVIVTVDCGIASLDEAVLARELGVDLIVTDHHEPKATLPLASCIVHPRVHQGQEPYPCGTLSGAGVAFKLIWGLCKRACGGAKVTPDLREFLLDAVVLAAMGTVADVVPLFDENRIFVRFGVQRLREKPSVGLQALLKCAKLDSKESLSVIDIGYALAPRINAAGRLGTARLAVELFTTKSEERAAYLADFLERQNQERQQIERKILQEARELAEKAGDGPALVLASENWHPGLLGIVASRLVDQYARPVLMIALRGPSELGQGSGRSVPGFRLHEALQDCTEHLASHGGHATAAGFRVPPKNLEGFRRQFGEVATRHFGPCPPPHCLTIDTEVPFSALTTGLLKSMGELEPYGSGNPQPLMLADRLQVVGDPKRVGGGDRHLSFRVRQNGKELRAIAFGMGDRIDELMAVNGQCSLVFTPRINEWQGFRNVEIEVRDFQSGPNPVLAG